MKNAILDIMMGLIVIVMCITLVGLFIVPYVLDFWMEMRQ